MKPKLTNLEHKTVETGLDTISFSKLGTIYLPSWPEGKTIETILSECSAIMADETKPEHVRYLATMTATLVEDLILQLPRGQWNPKAVLAAQTGILLGIHSERLALWPSELPAMRGTKSHNASVKKGRAAPKKSLRYFFEKSVPGWRNLPRSALLIHAKKQFPSREQENLLRQIFALKKADTRP